MADIVIKLILIKLIDNYEVKNTKEHAGRPKNIEIEGLVSLARQAAAISRLMNINSVCQTLSAN
jgi:hypothetical protein